MDRGIALSQQYGVDRLLQPIFDFVPTADSPPLAPKHVSAAPSRPRKRAAQSGAPSEEARTEASSATPEPGRGAAARAAAQRAAAVSRAVARTEESDVEDFVDADVDPYALEEERSLSPTPSGMSVSSETPSPIASDLDPAEYEAAMRARQSKRARIDRLTGAEVASAQLGHGPVRYARMILDFFVSESSQIPEFLIRPPADFDPNVVIDDDGHTALHWACAMGRTRIVKYLLGANADIFRANSVGQTALMRSVMYTNNYDLRKFPEIFELLHRSTINIDKNDRTVFHYIVDIAYQKGKTHAARYYLETVLNRLADYPKEVADILNFQDDEGETALTIAARARSKRLVKILLDAGADPKIANIHGKSAEDYILEDERFRAADLGASTSSSAAAAAVALGGGNGASLVSLAAGAASGALPQRLHTSEAGQRASTHVAPRLGTMVEELADAYDAHLAQHERSITQNQQLLGTIQHEILDSERILRDLTRTTSTPTAGESPSLIDEDLSKDVLTEVALKGKEDQLADELEQRMTRRFRFGWEKFIHDEEEREAAYVSARKSAAPEGTEDGATPSGVVAPDADLDEIAGLRERSDDDPAAQAEAYELRDAVLELQRKRDALFSEYVARRRESGTGDKLDRYRQLIALGASVPIESVEGVIDSLADSLDSDGFAPLVTA